MRRLRTGSCAIPRFLVGTGVALPLPREPEGAPALTSATPAAAPVLSAVPPAVPPPTGAPSTESVWPRKTGPVWTAPLDASALLPPPAWTVPAEPLASLPPPAIPLDPPSETSPAGVWVSATVGPTVMLGLTKRLLSVSSESGRDRAFEQEAWAQEVVSRTADLQEGLQSFAEVGQPVGQPGHRFGGVPEHVRATACANNFAVPHQLHGFGGEVDLGDWNDALADYGSS